MKKLLLICAVLISIPTFLYCASPGKIDYKKKVTSGSTTNTTEMTVTTPTSPVKPATLQGNIDGDMTASTGNQQQRDFAMEGITSIMTWAGVIVMIIGLGIAVGAGYIPLLNWRHGLFVMGGGGAIIALSVFLAEYTWVLLVLFFVVLAAGALLIYEEYDKEKKVGQAKNSGDPWT